MRWTWIAIVIGLSGCTPESAPSANSGIGVAAPVAAGASAAVPANGATVDEAGAALAADVRPPPDLVEALPTDDWLGKWLGPEGTFLELSRNASGYDIILRSLDGLATYEGVPAGDHIEFTRNGVRESIRAATGAKTGMKWLLDKHDCLVIREGEGFCRD